MKSSMQLFALVIFGLATTAQATECTINGFKRIREGTGRSSALIEGFTVEIENNTERVYDLNYGFRVEIGVSNDGRSSIMISVNDSVSTKNSATNRNEPLRLELQSSLVPLESVFESIAYRVDCKANPKN